MTDRSVSGAPTTSGARGAGRALAWSIGIAAAALAPMAPTWLAGQTLVCRDSLTIYAPLRHLVGEALREARLPLWQPFTGTGYPLFAEMMHGVLHPLSIAAALLFPGDSLDPLIGMNLAAAALGAAALARALGASRAASAAAGLAYALCGFTLSVSANFVFLVGAASLPWLVAGMLVAGRSTTPGAFAAAAAAGTAAALSGDVQAVLVGVCLGALLTIDASGVRGMLRSGAAVACGLLVAAVQLVPSWRHLALTDRGGAGLPFHVEAWSFPPWRLVELVSPGFFVQPEAGLDAPMYAVLGSPRIAFTPFAFSTYVGVAVLAFAAAGFRARRTGVLLGLATLALAWLSMGDHLGADRLLSAVPLVRSFRYTEKYQGPVALCLAMLAALGVDRAASQRQVGLRVTWFAALAVAVASAVWLHVRVNGGSALPASVPLADVIASNLERGLRHAIVSGAALLACAIAFARGHRRVASAAAVVLVWAAGAAASPYAFRPGRRDARIATPPPAVIADPPGPRLFHLVAPISRETAPGFDSIDRIAFGEGAAGTPNRNVPYGLDVLEPWTGLRPLRHVDVADAFERAPWVGARRYAATHAVFPPATTERGRAIVAEATRGGQRLPPDPRTGAEIWALPHRPWASFAPRVVRAAGRQEALDVLLRLAAEGSAAAVVEADEVLPAAPGRVLSVSRGIEELRIEAEAERDATLVVNDAFWPGWRVTVDGLGSPLYAADVLVRAVRFPAGRHVVEMRYEPPEVRVGTAISAASIVALFLAWITVERLRRAKP